MEGRKKLWFGMDKDRARNDAEISWAY